MRVVVNDRECELPEGITVAALLEKLEMPVRFLAVERNYELVPRKTFPEVVLRDGDRLEIVTLDGGG